MLRCPAMNGLGRRVALAAGWLLVAALVSLGAAGIVGAMAHMPGTPSRAELTYPGDKAIEPDLEAAEQGLLELAGEVRHLSDLGRQALSALVTRDVDALSAAVIEGEDLAVKVEALSSASCATSSRVCRASAPATSSSCPPSRTSAGSGRWGRSSRPTAWPRPGRASPSDRSRRPGSPCC